MLCIQWSQSKHQGHLIQRAFSAQPIGTMPNSNEKKIYTTDACVERLWCRLWK